MQYKNHYKFGVEFPTHKGVTIATSFNSPEFEEFIKNMDKLDYDDGHVPIGYEHRPDLISDLFYNTVTLDWLVLWFNNIEDPFQGVNIGDRVLIPKI